MRIEKKLSLFCVFFFCMLLLNAEIADYPRPPAGTRFNDGYNPFLAPMQTTNYYGSGDLNLDGVVDNTDLDLLGDIVVGTLPETPLADMNGDGAVDVIDSFPLMNYINNGTPLPGMWNSLTTREQRVEWVNKITAIDDTNTLGWSNGWFICAQYSNQLTDNCRGNRIDHYNKVKIIYNGGSVVYNIPMYTVSVVGSGHDICGILVGDNPENFADWYFIEPQLDNQPVPGEWNMLPGDINIMVADYTYQYPLITFNMAENLTASFVRSDSSLVKTRPAAPPIFTPDNRRDVWNPQILNVGNGKVIFSATQETMERNGDTDIFLSDLPYSANAARTVISESQVMGQLLDLYQDQSGVNHVLYIDKPEIEINNNTDNVYGLYYGIYDTSQGKIINAEPVLGNSNLAAGKAELFVEANGTVHVFWCEALGVIGGLFWTCKTSSGWQPTVSLVAGSNLAYYNPGNWVVRNLVHGCFDVTSAGSQLYLTWVGRQSHTYWNGTTFVNYDSWDVNYMVYTNGIWGAATQITDCEDATGVALKADDQGNIHVVYTRGTIVNSDPGIPALEESRGTLNHIFSNGSVWSTPTVIDDSAANLLPQMEVQPVTGDLYLVWEKKVNDRVVAAWNKYVNNQWSATQTLPVREGADAWYPTVKALSNGDVMVAFSSRSPDWVTIETARIGELPPPQGALTVYYAAQETAADTNMVRATFRIKNDGAASLNLSDITLRYWYTREGTSSQSGACDYAGIGGLNITSYVNLNFSPVVPGLTGADYYLTIGFNSGAGTLAPGQETNEIQVRFWKTDWTNYIQTGDYSFNANMTSLTENSKITGYVSGALEFGILP